MNKNFINMMHLFSCGATGKTPNILEPVDFAEVYSFAKQQCVSEMVFFTLKKMYDISSINIESQLYNNWSANATFSVMRSVQKLNDIHSIIIQFEKANINTCILKGEALARLYAAPSCRISGDCDILVDIDQENLACEILKKNDFTVNHRTVASHHNFCTHSKMGVVELHISLYYDFIQDVWFDNLDMICDEYIKIKVNDTEITTLGVTDGLLFTVLHALKHFLVSGVGIRQVMDCLLYIKEYKDQINWDRFNSIMKHLKYKKFVDTLIGIGVLYFDFDINELYNCTFDTELVNKMVVDMQNGGCFGYNEKERHNFYEIYNEQRFKTFKEENFHEYMTNWRRKSLFKMLSFSKDNMYSRYMYAKNNRLLLPIAWLNHVYVIVKTIVKRFEIIFDFVSYKKPKIKNDVAFKRMKLIKELEMI